MHCWLHSSIYLQNTSASDVLHYSSMHTWLELYKSLCFTILHVVCMTTNVHWFWCCHCFCYIDFFVFVCRPKLDNIDRSSSIHKSITVDSVTVVITEYNSLYPDSDWKFCVLYKYIFYFVWHVVCTFQRLCTCAYMYICILLYSCILHVNFSSACGSCIC